MSERTEFGFERTKCSCRECTINCEHMPGYLIPDDIVRISEYLGYTDVKSFAWDNLLASPGALVGRQLASGEIRKFRIPTLVPARKEDGSCKFLKDGMCSIHPVAPFGCAFMDAHQPVELSLKISSLGLIEIIKSDTYRDLWHQQNDLGFKAPGPEESREKLKQASIKEGIL